MLSICNKITGTDSYLTWTNRWSWQDNVSGFLFGCPHPRSIEPLLKIHGYDVKPLVEQKYLRMASELRLKEANFIGLIGPKFKEHLASYTQEMWKNFEKIFGPLWMAWLPIRPVKKPTNIHKQAPPPVTCKLRRF